MPTDSTRLHAVFDLAMSIGVGLLGNGAAASEVTATVLRVTSSSGLRNVSVQVTFDEVTISYLADETSAPFTRVRGAAERVQDFARLEAFEDVTHGYITGEISLEEARRRAHAIPQEKPFYRLGLVIAGFAVMGGGAAMSLGAKPLVVVAAMAAAGLLILTDTLLVRRQIPRFYSQAVGGFVGVLAAMLVSLIDPSQNSSIVVVACIIVLLAGLTSIGAMQDAVTGWYVTAAGRILETLMLTVGVVAGVRGGLLMADLIGVEVSVSASIPVTLTTVVMLAVAGVAMGLGFGVGTQVRPRLLIWSALIAAASSVISELLTEFALDRVYAVAVASFVVGAVAVVLGDTLRAPALIFVMCGIIPQVPGSRIYRGLLGLGDDMSVGATELFGAAEIAIAIAAGAILGQLLASRLLGRLRRTTIAYTPMISMPFTTLRRRRSSLGLGRSGRRDAIALAEPSTMTGEMTALSPSLLDDIPATEGQPDDREAP
ncbi:threonine/serine exporter family protein [Brachybacterium sp. DNPG3]